MSQTIELSDENIALLKEQASAHGLTVDAWIQSLLCEKAQAQDLLAARQRSEAAAFRILEIQKHVQPDPEGWTIRDYIDQGRL